MRERDGVFQRKDRHGWWISFVDSAGIRRKQKVTAHTRRQALNALAAVKTRIEREKVLGVRAASEISIEELFSRYESYQKNRVRSNTLTRTRGILKTLKQFLPCKANNVSRKTVADYISSRAEAFRDTEDKGLRRRASPATIQKEVTVLKHVLKLAVEWDLLHSNPAQGAKLPRSPQGRTRYLSPSELKAALEAAPAWMRAPLALAAFTGMRRGELLALRWIDVDTENRRLYLRETKNGSLRVVALNELAMQVLSSLPRRQPSEELFPDLNGQRLTVSTRRLFKRIGINEASFHSLRHTAASWLVMQGVDLYAVGQLLGHRTPRMTQRYAHLSPSYMAAAVSKLDYVFGDVMPRNSHTDLSVSPRSVPELSEACLNSDKSLRVFGVPDGI
jgi:integrase